MALHPTFPASPFDELVPGLTRGDFAGLDHDSMVM